MATNLSKKKMTKRYKTIKTMMMAGDTIGAAGLLGKKKKQKGVAGRREPINGAKRGVNCGFTVL